MRQSNIRTLLCVCAAATGIGAAAGYVHASADIIVTTVSTYECMYNNADIDTESEEDGNEYQLFSYNGLMNRDRAYYDIKVADIKSSSNSYADSGRLQVNYDVMYSNIDTEKDGEVQIKYRTGSGSTQTEMVARVGKNNDYFRYHKDGSSLTAFKDTEGNTLDIEVGRWYSIKIIVDLDNATQTTYFFDRDTQKLLCYSDSVSTENGNHKVNMVTFSSGTDMCVDNIEVFVSDSERAYVYGEPYLSSSETCRYFLFGLTSDGNLTSPPHGETVWSMRDADDGVTLDTETGKVTIGSNPVPGSFVICATRQSDDGDVTGYQLGCQSFNEQ